MLGEAGAYSDHTEYYIEITDETSQSLAKKCPPGENKGMFTLSDLQLLILDKDRLLSKEELELDVKSKPNEVYWNCFL